MRIIGDYPGGTAGLALLIMRLHAAGLVSARAPHLCERGYHIALPAIAVLLSLATGTMTRVAAAIVLAGLLGFENEFGTTTLYQTCVAALGCLACVVGGAGAYSIDAILSGHRRVLLIRRLPDWPSRS